MSLLAKKNQFFLIFRLHQISFYFSLYFSVCVVNYKIEIEVDFFFFKFYLPKRSFSVDGIANKYLSKERETYVRTTKIDLQNSSIFKES